MTQLAIKGHPARGNEVIEILEMLGGKTSDRELYGNVHHYGYYIQDKGYVSLTHCSLLKNAIVFTLEEFLEKFPYKVGNKVKLEYYPCTIQSMEWDSSKEEILYTVKGDDFCNCVYVADLQPYKEETMEETKEDLCVYSKLDFEQEPCADKVELVLGDNYEIKVEDGKTYVVKKNPKYPKTYEECCAVLGIDTSRTIEHDNLPFYKDETCYEYALLSSLAYLRKLLICRDAYWKIAGEQMKLGKPWEPNWLDAKQDKYVIFTNNNTICSNRYVLGHNILAFPTEEMRDAFFKNFEKLIKKCISLL